MSKILKSSVETKVDTKVTSTKAKVTKGEETESIDPFSYALGQSTLLLVWLPETEKVLDLRLLRPGALITHIQYLASLQSGLKSTLMGSNRATYLPIRISRY